MPQPIYAAETTHDVSDSTQQQHIHQTATDTNQNATLDHIQTLACLDKQHDQLTKVEEALETYIQELQAEEKILRTALEQSSTSLKEQREREKIQKEEEAMARLEGVLMGGDSSSDSDES